MKVVTLYLQTVLFILCDANNKRSSVIKEQKPSAKFDNPNFVRDRIKDEISKPQMPDLYKERHRKPYNPAWMDFCDPYHCNDYHKIACGLNRANMRFKWFQSVCHVILNNKCSTYRGALKYDLVDTKFCMLYVMHLRAGCPRVCDDEVDPVCSISLRNHVVLFKSRCAMDSMNCKKNIPEYDEVDMSMCEYLLSGK